MVLDSNRPGYERRKLPDPTTPRLLVSWTVILVLFLWVAQRFFKQDLYYFDGYDWSMTTVGVILVFSGSTFLAVLLSGIFYKFKYGKYHFVSILRVVRGILSLFFLTVAVFWPISLMIIALNPLQSFYLMFLGGMVLVLLACFIRLAAKPEMGFWRDWLNDTLLRW